MPIIIARPIEHASETLEGLCDSRKPCWFFFSFYNLLRASTNKMSTEFQGIFSVIRRCCMHASIDFSNTKRQQRHDSNETIAINTKISSEIKIQQRCRGGEFPLPRTRIIRCFNRPRFTLSKILNNSPKEFIVITNSFHHRM